MNDGAGRGQSTRRSWREAALVYTKAPVVAMLALGFAAGLPYLLVFTTLSIWLRDVDVAVSAIGFFSWIGVTYSVKFAWAPVIDRLPVPGLTRWLGKRRSWILMGQLGIIAGLTAMALADPAHDLWWVAVTGLLVAFSSATQDVALDAFRVEAVAVDMQGAMASTYILGYRLALLTASTGALLIADFADWSCAYLTMAALMLVGVVTVLLVSEPAHHADSATYRHERRVIAYLERSAHLPRLWRGFSAWFIGAVICPLTDFFHRYGRLSLAVLALVATFRISDIVMGSMAGPLYVELGFSKTEIGTVTGAYGLIMTILGAAAGGVTVMRYGVMRPLLAGAVAVAATNLLFAYMAEVKPTLWLLALVISADNLSGGFGVAVFVAYLSGLVNVRYTATQYALLSSLMTLPGKLLGGISGFVVEALGYSEFFLLASALGVPAIVLVVFLSRRDISGET